MGPYGSGPAQWRNWGCVTLGLTQGPTKARVLGNPQNARAKELPILRGPTGVHQLEGPRDLPP